MGKKYRVRRKSNVANDCKQAVNNCTRGDFYPEDGLGLTTLLAFSGYRKKGEKISFDADRIKKVGKDCRLSTPELTLRAWIKEAMEKGIFQEPGS